MPSHATLVLQPVGRPAGSRCPDFVVRRRRRADRARLRRADSQGQDRLAHRRHPAAPGRHQLAVLGQAAGTARGDRRLQDQRQVRLRVARVRRRSRILPRLGGRQGLPAAVGVARSDRRRQLRSVPARHLRLDRHLSRLPPRRRLQDRGQHLSRKDVHAGAQGDERVAQSQPVRSARRGDCRGARQERGGSARADRPGAVPAGRGAARRPDRRGRLRRRARRSRARVEGRRLHRRRGLRRRCRGSAPACAAARRSR